MEDTEIVKEYASGLPQVNLFKNRFQQVIVNLCNNAIDAMGRSGKIYVTTSENTLEGKRAVEISIRDTGSGMPPEVLEKIFNPFFTTKESGKGTGLGLSLVSEILEQHQGRIKAESKVGKGTTFRILIPV